MKVQKKGKLVKKILKKHYLLSAGLIIGATLSSATPLLADSYDYYWATPNSGHIQPLYSSAYDCYDSHSAAECVNFGPVCGVLYTSTERVLENARRFGREGYTLEIKNRANTEILCTLTP